MRLIRSVRCSLAPAADAMRYVCAPR